MNTPPEGAAMNPSPFARHYLTTEELADDLDCAPRTLRRMRHDGTGPAWTRITPPRGRSYVIYFLNDVQPYMEANIFYPQPHNLLRFPIPRRRA